MTSGRGEHIFGEGGRPLGVSDQPISGQQEDSLSLSREARALARFIASSVTPLTIAIQGDWGSGKTSLLRIIEEELDPKQDGKRVNEQGRIEVIRFETWQYAQFGGGPALPLSLLSMLDKRLSPPGVVSRAGNVLKKLARPAASAALKLASHDLLELGEGGPTSVDFAEETDELRRALSDTVAGKLKKGVERIVVLIDDLDRVDPALAIEILQTIKMFLDLEHCVFVLALDFAVVKDGVRKKFGIQEESKARAFFDKIIQLPFQVPTAKYDTGGFLMRLLRTLNDPDLGRDQAALLVPLARTSISTNPRAIKRVMNSLHLNRLLAADELDALGARRPAAITTLFALLCMQARFPEAYSWLMEQADPSAAIQALQAAEPGKPNEALDAIRFEQPQDREAFILFARTLAKVTAPLLSSGTDTFNGVLSLTRSTSVGEQGAAYKFTADLREANKEVMQGVVQACETALPGVTFATKSDRGGGMAVEAEVRPGVTLSLEHGSSWLGLTAYAEKHLGEAVLRVLPDAYRAGDGTIHVWDSGVFDTTPMWRRNDYLKEGPGRFAAAWRALQGADLAA